MFAASVDVERWSIAGRHVARAFETTPVPELLDHEVGRSDWALFGESASCFDD